MTFTDLCNLLKKEDEVTVLELLNLSSEQLVDALESYVEDRQEYLRNYYADPEEVGGQEELNESY